MLACPEYTKAIDIWVRPSVRPSTHPHTHPPAHSIQINPPPPPPEGNLINHPPTHLYIQSVGCIFAELLQRQPLFPGNDYIDQLRLICSKLGRPTEQEMHFIPSARARRYPSHPPTAPTHPPSPKGPNLTLSPIFLAPSFWSPSPPIHPPTQKTGSSSPSHPPPLPRCTSSSPRETCGLSIS